MNGIHRNVTMHDVAQAAGVSVKTVSNVVNDYPHIRPTTRAKVEKAIDQLGYKINLSARSLRQGRTGIVGLALPELSLPYFAELADSVIQAAERKGLVVLIEQTNADRQHELDVLSSERRRLTDGLIYSPLALGPEDADALKVDYPLVVLGERIFGGDWDHVTMNNVEAARAATQHLIDGGRRRIAVVGAHAGETMGSAALRVLGYQAALAANGIPFDPALVVEGGLWHRSTGAECVERLLAAEVPFDAVFGLNDALALGALHALHARRIDVPGAIAVIGFDNIDDSAYSAPTLTTIAPGRDQIAERAVDMLLRRIEGDTRPFERIVTDYAVVKRESTDA